MNNFWKAFVAGGAVKDIGNMMDKASERAYEAGYNDAMSSNANTVKNEGKSDVVRDEEGFVIETGSGVFLGGVDLRPGLIRMTAFRGPNTSSYSVYYSITDNPNNTEVDSDFNSQTYVSIKKGEFLVVDSPADEVKIKFENIK